MVFILLYSPIIVHYFQTRGIYANPFFRIMEFSIGIILCSCITSIRESRFSGIVFSWWAIVIEYALLMFLVTKAVSRNLFVNDCMMYNWVALPIFMLQIVSMYGARFPRCISGSKLFSYLSEITYSFFLAQLCTWRTVEYIFSISATDTNLFRIVISATVCIGYTLLLHELFEKPISRFLKKRFLKMSNT